VVRRPDCYVSRILIPQHKACRFSLSLTESGGNGREENQLLGGKMKVVFDSKIIKLLVELGSTKLRTWMKGRGGGRGA